MLKKWLFGTTVEKGMVTSFFYSKVTKLLKEKILRI